MSIAKAYSAQLSGLTSETVTIEVDISNGLHSFSIVGLGDRAVDEAKDRISAAIKNSGFVSPKQKNQKVVISLAPADIKKEGTSFDVAMALAYLHAAGEAAFDPEGILFLGELSLEGNIRAVSGALPILCQSVKNGFHTAFVPTINAPEASLARGLRIFAVSSLNETIATLARKNDLRPIRARRSLRAQRPKNTVDISDVRGNAVAKRALEIAAAGAHNIILCGPPGTGKTMLAKSFPSILPPLSYDQSVEVTGIHSAARTLDEPLIAYPPFRSPHHTASYPSIVGGGTVPKPGEITLAHRGVLFLDELPEFDRSVLEALRQPIEDRIISISRARGTVTFPAQCILVASMNPCPCGKGPSNGCSCSAASLAAYSKKISGPIMDRLDIWVNVSKIDYERLSAVANDAEPSEKVRRRIVTSRKAQRERFIARGLPLHYNAEMGASEIESCISMEDGVRDILTTSARKLELSARAFHRVIKVARTIADIAGCEDIKMEHILEALQYRQKTM